MLIGLLSDTHNNAATTRAALAIFRQEGVTRLLHCGDITGGEIVLLFAGWEATFVLGNMDRAVAELEAAASQIGCAPPRPAVNLVVDGYPIALLHGHDGLERAIQSGAYRYVIHGHTHLHRDERLGATRVINPGALGGTRREGRSVAVLDTAADRLRFIPVPEET
ncbi:MAG: YfcE family phosphodiesterase [Anaerolineae bacterium]|nr:YfcE family phosphodiesterase [Anaerolineae bacterium]